MSPNGVVVRGTLTPDGKLELDEKPGVPPGPVHVTVAAIRSEPSGEDTWCVLERIWARRQARDARPRAAEDIDAQINLMRDESEERMSEIAQAQMEARCARGRTSR